MELHNLRNFPAKSRGPYLPRKLEQEVKPEPPNKVDSIVSESVRRCLASTSPLSAMDGILEAVSLNTILTDAEFAEIKRRTIGAVADACDTDEPPDTIPLR